MRKAERAWRVRLEQQVEVTPALAAYSLGRTPVMSAVTATRTRVTPRPHPEGRYQGLEAVPRLHPGPTGHSQGKACPAP